MILYNIIFSIRNLLREKVSTLVKIVGLCLGLTIFLVIFSYVNFERSYDTFFSNYKNVSRIGFENISESGQVWNGAYTPVPLMEEAIKVCPEVVSATRLYNADRESAFFVDDQAYETSESYFVDSSFFTVFNVDLLYGNRKTVLENPNTTVLSKTTAKKIFGEENPVGKEINYKNQRSLIVTGVFEDFPVNSTVKADILISFNTRNFIYPNRIGDWNLHFVGVYMLLQPGADQDNIARKLTEIASANRPTNSKNASWRIYLEPIEKIHLYTQVINGNTSTVSSKTINLLLFIAFFILVIALINHLNLSITQVLKRIKQIGIERASGQKQLQLLGKSICESTIVFAVALVITIALMLVIVPAVNTSLSTSITWKIVNWQYLVKVFGILSIGIIVTALFELLFISRVQLTNALAGKLNNSNGNKGLKRVLISFQFLVSLVLISVTLVFYYQTTFMFEKDLGMENSNMIVVKGNTLDLSGKEYPDKLNSFKQELLSYPNITGVTTSNVIPGQHAYSDGVGLVSDPNMGFVNNSIIQTDNDFIQTYNIKLIAGRDFSNLPVRSDKHAIINEKCAKALGFENAEEAIGQKIIRDYLNKEYEIVGVTENFSISNSVSDVVPLTIYKARRENRFYSIKYSSMQPGEVVSQIKSAWKKVLNEDACRYFFLDNSYKKVYESEFLQVKIYSICSLMAVIIACIGLFGLAYYSIVEKTKEIGVRKVNGARESDILMLIYKEYFNLIILSTIPGVIIAYLISLKWLENYYHKIELGVQFFILPVLIMVMVTIITISYNAIIAATKNPVEALRNE
jgi:putative ABC transport system permease protein